VAYYNHRHRGIYKTNILQAVKQARARHEYCLCYLDLTIEMNKSVLSVVEAVFTEAKSWINDPGLFSKTKFGPDILQSRIK
jgi:hypothetical protein